MMPNLIMKDISMLYSVTLALKINVKYRPECIGQACTQASTFYVKQNHFS